MMIGSIVVILGLVTMLSLMRGARDCVVANWRDMLLTLRDFVSEEDDDDDEEDDADDSGTLIAGSC